MTANFPTRSLPQGLAGGMRQQRGTMTEGRRQAPGRRRAWSQRRSRRPRTTSSIIEQPSSAKAQARMAGQALCWQAEIIAMATHSSRQKRVAVDGGGLEVALGVAVDGAHPAGEVRRRRVLAAAAPSALE